MPFAVSCRLLLAFAAALSTMAASAQTKSFRCKNDLVSIGDSKASVLQKCGQPVLKDAFCKPNPPITTPGNASGAPTVQVQSCTDVDDWTYNPGYGQFMTSLQFEGGRLARIQYGERAK